MGENSQARLLRVVLLLGVVLSVGLVVAGGFVALRLRDGGTTATTNTAAEQPVDRRAQAAAFVDCMRRNGVPNFPDPQPDGSVAIAPDDGVDLAAPAFKSAEKACQGVVPGGSQRGGVAAPSAAAPSASSAPSKPTPKPSASASAAGGDRFAQATAFVACMRTNGVPTFPDPAANGALQITPEDADITSAAFQGAEKACKKLMPPPR